MIKCPSCSHENVDGTTFCEMCGEDLQSSGAATGSAVTNTATAPAASASSEIKCPACENMNPAENVVCEVCGTELRGGDDLDATTDSAVTAPPVITPPPPATISDADTAQTVATPAPDVAATPDAPAIADTATVPDVAVVTPPPGGATAPSTPVVPDVTATMPAPGGATAPSATAPVAAAPDAAAAPSSSASLSPGKVKLVVEQGMTVGKQFVLGDSELQVGREDEDEGIYPDIDLADQDEGYVHRKHATLKFENNQLFVTHLGGANRTRLNNKPIPDNSPQPVSLGDKIAFGKVVVRVQSL